MGWRAGHRRITTLSSLRADIPLATNHPFKTYCTVYVWKPAVTDARLGRDILVVFIVTFPVKRLGRRPGP